jgi:hypothetical protein
MFWSKWPSLPPDSAGFLLGLLFNHEVGGEMFLRNVWLSPNYMALQSSSSYYSRLRLQFSGM